MSRSSIETPVARRRGRFEGMCNVIRFNWPLYVVGVSILGAAAVLAAFSPVWLRVILISGVAVATYLIAASALVSHWVYDRSKLYRFDWLTPLAGDSPRALVNLHSGFDESSEAIAALFPDSQLQVLDFYNRQTMTEPSIARARRFQERQASAWLKSVTRNVDPTALPLADGGIDTAFLLLAAHEVRDLADRQKLFAELARSLSPRGRVILVEHLRDAANFAVFGPQFVHFFSRRTWLDVAAAAGLNLVCESRITPFVGVFVFEKP